MQNGRPLPAAAAAAMLSAAAFYCFCRRRRRGLLPWRWLASPEQDPVANLEQLPAEPSAADHSTIASLSDPMELRAVIMRAHASLRAAEAALASQAREQRSSASRKCFLVSLEDLIGPPPDRGWRDELEENTALVWPREIWTTEEHGHCFQNRNDCRRHLADVLDRSLLRWTEKDVGVHPAWTESLVRAFHSLSWPRPRRVIAYGLREGVATFAACTYALGDVLDHVSMAQEGGPMPPRLYRALHGRFGLCDDEPLWSELEVPDAAGFKGLTSRSLTKGTCDARSFAPDGFAQYQWESQSNVVQQSDVVCFESAPTDEQGHHAAIMLPGLGGGSFGCFPPNCPFRLKQIVAAGEWEAPGACFPRRRLLVVTATYWQPPTSLRGATEGGKLCGHVATLQYGTRASYVAGIDDLIAAPLLTMADEFSREGEWCDWKGVQYTLRSEWEYVNGRAFVVAGTPGVRDACNHGKLPTDFLAEANRWIAQQRAMSHGTSLPEEHALLTLDEVLALRLYSGPAYQPLNAFLREIGKLSGMHRQAMARHPGLTFTATVAHICAAIRKLAAVATPEEATAPLWRGVRGELPPSFWVRDSVGLVCAVKTAFMSTSRARATPIAYMGAGPNVLWALQPRTESDAAYHTGADISLLSQFGREAETLFPPCTMLRVLRDRCTAEDDCAKRDAELNSRGEAIADAQEEGGKSFVCIRAQPSFV